MSRFNLTLITLMRQHLDPETLEESFNLINHEETSLLFNLKFNIPNLEDVPSLILDK